MNLARTVLIAIFVLVLFGCASQDNQFKVNEKRIVATKAAVEQAKVDPDAGKPYLVPILLGKTPSEVKEKYGRIPDETRKHGNDFSLLSFYWAYKNSPSQGYITRIEYWPYEGAEGKEWNDPPKKVYWGFCYKEENNTVNLSPSDIIPSFVLSQKPKEICRIDCPDNQLAVIWHINNRMYFLHVTDSQKRLYDDVQQLNEKGELETKSQLNDNGRNFENCDTVISFLYTDHIPQIFDQPAGFGTHYPNKGDVRNHLLGSYFCKFEK